MRRCHYDLVLGMGFACSCSQTLRAAGLQHLSFPFDWVAPDISDSKGYRHEILRRADQLARDFPDWLRLEDFRFIRTCEETGKDIHLNTRLGLTFPHDFPARLPAADAFPGIMTKYRRRIDRLLVLFSRSRRVLLVRIDRPDLPITTDPADFMKVRSVLEAKFPLSRIDLLLLSPDGDRKFENRAEERLGEGFTRISFDYKSRIPGSEAYQPDIRCLAQLLKARISVRDYRTREERRRHRKSVNSFLRLWDCLRIPIARLRQKKFDQIVPLGYNCETAFRFYCKWGFLDASLFAWTSLSSINRLIEAISNPNRIGAGEMRFSQSSRMWTCRLTDICFHGRMKAVPGQPPASQAEIDADLADLLGRISHLRAKFTEYATNGKSTLFVYKPRPEDVERHDFNSRLDDLEAAIAGIGSRNWKLLVVCERPAAEKIHAGENRIVRSVRRYAPKNDVTNRKKGDPTGWNLIFTEFAPRKILPKKHKFKFE